MTPGERWLAGYVRAWATKDEADIRAIFTDDAEYLYSPYEVEPVRGIDAIVASWQEPEPEGPTHDLRVLIEDETLAIITGTVDYTEHGHFSNLWEVHLAPDGRARRFVEWFMQRPDER